MHVINVRQLQRVNNGAFPDFEYPSVTEND